MPAADVVVCGAGMSGLCAAVAAAEQGAHVVVLEKGPQLGGSFAWSGGVIHAYTNFAEIVPHADHALCALVAERLEDDLRWLEGLGVVATSRIAEPFHVGIVVDPDAALAVLRARLRDLDVEVRTGAALGALSPGEELAVVLRDGAGRVQARAVVVATGGFQGSPALVERWAGAPGDAVTLRANPWSTGDGIVALLEVGAQLTPGLDQFYGHALPDIGRAIEPSELVALTQYWGNRSVALNLRGERFVDESSVWEIEPNRTLAHQPEATGFFVADHRLLHEDTIDVLRDGTRDVAESPSEAAVRRAAEAGAAVVVADTLEDLCRRLDDEHGVPRARALVTLTAYNAVVRGETRDAQSPARRAHRVALEVPPFTAIRVRSAITGTAGGVAVTPDLAPVAGADADPASSTIAGVFVAGLDVGNVMNGGYIGGLAVPLVFGRLAGENAARHARTDVAQQRSA